MLAVSWRYKSRENSFGLHLSTRKKNTVKAANKRSSSNNESFLSKLSVGVLPFRNQQEFTFVPVTVIPTRQLQLGPQSLSSLPPISFNFTCSLQFRFFPSSAQLFRKRLLAVYSATDRGGHGLEYHPNLNFFTPLFFRVFLSKLFDLGREVLLSRIKYHFSARDDYGQ